MRMHQARLLTVCSAIMRYLSLAASSIDRYGATISGSLTWCRVAKAGGLMQWDKCEDENSRQGNSKTLAAISCELYLLRSLVLRFLSPAMVASSCLFRNSYLNEYFNSTTAARQSNQDPGGCCAKYRIRGGRNKRKQRTYCITHSSIHFPPRNPCAHRFEIIATKRSGIHLIVLPYRSD